MRRYRHVESELLAMQWTAETHGEVVRWLTVNGFGFHFHDRDGEIFDGDPPDSARSMCLDTGDDMEIELGWWLIYDHATGELSYDLPGFTDVWRLAE